MTDILIIAQRSYFVKDRKHFCCVCGQFTTKLQCRCISSLQMYAYHACFGMQLGEQVNTCKPHIVCVVQSSSDSVAPGQRQGAGVHLRESRLTHLILLPKVPKGSFLEDVSITETQVLRLLLELNPSKLPWWMPFIPNGCGIWLTNFGFLLRNCLGNHNASAPYRLTGRRLLFVSH